MTLLRILPLLGLCRLAAAADDINWLISYDAKSPPSAPWTANGTPKAALEAEGLHLTDDDAEFANYRAAWTPDAAEEIIVEAVVKVVSTTGAVKGKTSASVWPWRDGAPVSVLVSDGRHQEGIVLFANQAASHTDRFIPMDTTNRFHTYRLIIRGTDMSLWVDGERKVEVNIFDLDRDLYGETITVRFVERVRGEMRFADLEALKEQLHRDDTTVRQRMANRS